MVNPYAVNPAQRDQPAKPQVLLGQSTALKKFEKFQNKYNPNQSSVDRKKEKKKEKAKNRANKHILDTTDESDDDDDDDDEDSLFKSTNKFLKKKPAVVPESDQDNSDVTEDKSDIEISIQDQSRSSTPNRQRLGKMGRKSPAILRSNNSSAASMRSMTHTHTHKRSQSKVKFVNDYSEEEQSTIIDDMMSKNLIMDIDELEAHTLSISAKNNKNKAKRLSKSPLAMAARKRSESVTSIQEESILESSSNDGPSEIASLLETNLILDIGDLEKSISKEVRKSKKGKKQMSLDTESRSSKRDRKHRKDQKTMSESITTFLDKTDSSIATESVRDLDEDDDDIRTVRSDIGDISTRSRNRSSYHSKPKTKDTVSQSYFDDFETTDNRTTRQSTTRKSTKNKSTRKSGTSKTTSRQHSYFEDFETTDFDVDQTPRTPYKKQLSFYEGKIKPTSNAECQCDPADLLKNSQLLNTVNVYNPSSILLATTSHLNDPHTLKDLNQLTGYTMINQAFNDILKVNINFVKNFLGAQRSLYEQQISSIKPKPRDY